MGGLRRRVAVGALSLMALLTCACATFSKRSAEALFSEDVQNHGFLITYHIDSDAEDFPVTTVAAGDAESTNRMIQWFHQRPRPLGHLESELLQHIERQITGEVPTLTIETPHFRVSIRMLLVVLEARSSAHDRWTQVLWELRKEDNELREWAFSQVKETYKRSLQERGLLSTDADEPVDTDGDEE